jgi:hypothetical protein
MQNAAFNEFVDELLPSCLFHGATPTTTMRIYLLTSIDSEYTNQRKKQKQKEKSVGYLNGADLRCFGVCQVYAFLDCHVVCEKLQRDTKGMGRALQGFLGNFNEIIGSALLLRRLPR